MFNLIFELVKTGIRRIIYLIVFVLVILYFLGYDMLKASGNVDNFLVLIVIVLFFATSIFKRK